MLTNYELKFFSVVPNKKMLKYRGTIRMRMKVQTMNYEESIEFLLDIPLFGKKAALKNTKELLEQLNHPETGKYIIHVAGTNGKGSVCAMLSGIYMKQGLKVGLFTSPHLEKINERIRIQNEPIPDAAIIDLTYRIRKEIIRMTEEGHNHPTFFETMLAMAMLAFDEADVDLIIMETGIGGRLDPTNAIESTMVSVITQIDYDHTDILGDTLEEIAAEKAGIIKNGGIVVLQDPKPDVAKVVEAACIQQSATFYRTPLESVHILKSAYNSIDFSINSKYYKYDKVHLNNGAFYQIDNAVTALTVVNCCRDQIEIDQVKVVEALSAFNWPGRMELIDERILLDGAHNPSGMAAFVKALNNQYRGRKIILLIASMKDKDCDRMIGCLKDAENIQHIIVTQVHGQRCLPAQDMKTLLTAKGFDSVEIELDLKQALNRYLPRQGSQLFCCVGSLYLIGEIKKLIGGGFLDDKF